MTDNYGPPPGTYAAPHTPQARPPLPPLPPRHGHPTIEGEQLLPPPPHGATAVPEPERAPSRVSVLLSRIPPRVKVLIVYAALIVGACLAGRFGYSMGWIVAAVLIIVPWVIKSVQFDYQLVKMLVEPTWRKPLRFLVRVTAPISLMVILFYRGMTVKEFVHGSSED